MPGKRETESARAKEKGMRETGNIKMRRGGGREIESREQERQRAVKRQRESEIQQELAGGGGVGKRETRKGKKDRQR